MEANGWANNLGETKKTLCKRNRKKLGRLAGLTFKAVIKKSQGSMAINYSGGAPGVALKITTTRGKGSGNRSLIILIQEMANLRNGSGAEWVWGGGRRGIRSQGQSVKERLLKGLGRAIEGIRMNNC
jgi:hypothetical protein